MMTDQSKRERTNNASGEKNYDKKLVYINEGKNQGTKSFEDSQPFASDITLQAEKGEEW